MIKLLHNHIGGYIHQMRNSVSNSAIPQSCTHLSKRHGIEFLTHKVAEILKYFYELLFLLGTHPGEDGPFSGQDLPQFLLEMFTNDFKTSSVHGEVVAGLLDGQLDVLGIVAVEKCDSVLVRWTPSF